MTPENLMPIRIARVLTIGYIACLVIGAVIPNPGRADLVRVSDGWLHAVAYGILGGLLVFSQESARGLRLRVLKAVFGVLGVGLVTEILQLWVPYRRFEIGDLVADGVGGLVIASVVVLSLAVRNRTGGAP